MNKDLEQELEDKIHLLESMTEDTHTKSLEYHCDLFETVKTFNDYLCIVFLNLTNILTKYEKRAIRIKPDDAIKMANNICKRMQSEFEDNFSIRETVDRISKVEKITEPEFDVKDITKVETTKSRTKVIKKN